jgi:hypothetical protein
VPTAAGSDIETVPTGRRLCDPGPAGPARPGAAAFAADPGDPIDLTEFVTAPCGLMDRQHLAD